ncbi:MAG TPA: F0F1 ATP synthase subunit alpha [Candidatus Woesebacteria bacterium]|nr:F0F1 ATP synthase subunit alpha [Candidatus Woesebacteria bacterium]HNS94530.1 F0F1 ATP synthase subunit alpha [Candidatus Woesebacteria bacterium]
MSNQLINQYIKEFEKELHEQSLRTEGIMEVGNVEEVKDGVISARGLDNASYGELVTFETGTQGMIVDMTETNVGIIVLGSYENITAGSRITATGKTLSIEVGEALLGRVVDALAIPEDGQEKPKAEARYPVEKIAPGVVKRKSVSVPIQTGIKAVDALVPIGRGQRELIIGDRGTGKTTICLDTIINQKGQDVLCVYCAIGQKNAKIAATYELLKAQGAMDYTVIVKASASDPVAMQYLAPYSATAIAEYSMDQGKDVLVVYDDLTKHAYAYRQVSLILRRPAGREAYPGDVFYLHSRLLERSCRLSDAAGGGSITALPIIETLENDLSAYIPTNVISITDGQIFLETDLFNAGMRPAINVGMSVSRVGGSAQTKAMKQVAGKLKLDLAQYRELASFAQFDSDLDDETKKFLNRGARATEVLKQQKNQPLDLAHEVVILWAIAHGYLDSVEIPKVKAFEYALFQMCDVHHKKLLERINKQKSLDSKDEEELKRIMDQLVI